MPVEPWYVYILQCADGSYYVGHTDDLDERVSQHNAGRGATWTAWRRPVMLVYQESCASMAEAVKRERQVKRWSRAKKAALISGDLEQLHRLSRRRIP
ncbi:MAG TPA: GIY-YIG nuclease family protein [Phycisphaerae bacterium]|nr:GIY-YIG nuclease family protein [Phycisphaerae bacterium]